MTRRSTTRPATASRSTRRLVSSRSATRQRSSTASTTTREPSAAGRGHAPRDRPARPRSGSAARAVPAVRRLHPGRGTTCTSPTVATRARSSHRTEIKIRLPRTGRGVPSIAAVPPPTARVGMHGDLARAAVPGISINGRAAARDPRLRDMLDRVVAVALGHRTCTSDQRWPLHCVAADRTRLRRLALRRLSRQPRSRPGRQHCWRRLRTGSTKLVPGQA